MADLLRSLPDFDVTPYSHLLHSLDKNQITVSDLITLDPIEIAKACPLPLGDIRDLVRDVVEALQKDVGICPFKHMTSSELLPASATTNKSRRSSNLLVNNLKESDVIKTLDPVLDEALGGGFHTRCITEIAGESAAGKTQFVLGLLLSVQLPPPYGLSRSAIYISTETPLSTNRLLQIQTSNPIYTNASSTTVPSFDHIHSIPVNDLEAQEHIIEYQLPLAVKQYNVGLVVMDSVAANYRAEYETKTTEGLSERAKDISKLGTMLRALAIEHNLAIVATNQVSDRFDEPAARMAYDLLRSSSPSFSSSPAPPQPTQPPTSGSATRLDEVMSLDHQQRFFSGWGDEDGTSIDDMKTPALGLAWTLQLDARIVLKVESERVVQRPDDYVGGNIWADRKRRRFMSVVFAPWVGASVVPVEYEIRREGIVGLRIEKIGESDEGHGRARYNELLDENFWGLDGLVEDEEFP